MNILRHNSNTWLLECSLKTFIAVSTCQVKTVNIK